VYKNEGGTHICFRDLNKLMGLKAILLFEKNKRINIGTEVKNNRACINLIRIILSYSSICIDER